ncbi:hypothetical protein V8E36_009194 [Tilletia maclaganii]
MKFAKTYIETLASSHFPEEWKRGAVDYKQLKKLINGVVAELESIGLGADVLKDLLVPPAEEVSPASPASAIPAHASQPPPTTTITLNDTDADADTLHNLPTAEQFEQRRGSASTSRSFADETPAEQWIETLPHSRSHSANSNGSGGVLLGKPVASSSPSNNNNDSLIPPPPSSSLSPTDESLTHKKGRKSHSAQQPKTPADLMRTHDTLMRRATSASSSHSQGSASASGSGSGSAAASQQGDRATSPGFGDRLKPRDGFQAAEVGKTHLDHEGNRWLNGKDGRRARAEYELGGTQEHPVPRIRLFIESPIGSDEEDEDEAADDDHESEDTDTSQQDLESAHASDPIVTLPHRSPARSFTPNTIKPTMTDEDNSPITLRGRPIDSPAGSLLGRTPIITTAGVEADQAAAEEASQLEALPEAALDADSHLLRPDDAHAKEQRHVRRRRRRHKSPSTGHRFRRREITIPLTADTEFLESLTGALSNLSRIQTQQREHFVAATENLCSSIARVASPYATPTDMYVWREIFALWVDSQIFESSREKDRGELSVEESEVRLRKFAEELAKRGWIAREAHLSDEVVEEEGEGADGGAAKKKRKTSGFLMRRHGPHASQAGATKYSGNTMTLPDGTVAHVPQHAHTQSALDDFLKLNVELLDVKKFQAVNVEAARKILKKHDKRTALTAASDLRAFMALQEREQREMIGRLGGANGRESGGLSGAERLNLMEVNGGIAPRPLTDAPHALPLANFDSLSLSHGTTGGSRQLTTTMTHPSLAALLPTSATGLMGGSLPHILLSLMTTTLLPILPSIDESSCVICTSVAWRPVRLICGHLFCIRCLVKLQRQHRDDCPLCRAPQAVKLANAGNLDEAMGNLLKTYFPEEVKVKQKENDREVQAEEEREMGLEKTNLNCVIC